MTTKGGKKTVKKYTKRARAVKMAGECSGYCVKCRKPRTMNNCRRVTSKNGRSMMKGICRECGTKMNKFV